MSKIFGIDFGTTNTIATYIDIDPKTRKPRPFPLKSRGIDHRPHPSVLCYEGGPEPLCGHAAKAKLKKRALGVTDNTVRSPKKFLDSAHGIVVEGIVHEVTDVVADYLRFIRKDALDRKIRDQDFSHAIFTIPVSMDGLARARLRDAAQNADIHVNQFVHEPLAALYGYLRNLPDSANQFARLENRMMLVFDWGGGTLDLTLVQMTGGVLTQIRNTGSIYGHIGGDDFDNRILQLVKKRHVQQYPKADWNLIQSSAEAKLIEACEDTKIKLSTEDSNTVYVRKALALDGKAADVNLKITREELETEVRDLIDAGIGKINDLLDTAGIHRNSLEFCLATGGMVSMPAIRDRLQDFFGINRLKTVPNSDSIISEGAAWIAYDKAILGLAKPLELVHARGTYLPLLDSGYRLPTENKETKLPPLILYCTDPRDGFAKLQFVRPRFAGNISNNETRVPYCIRMLPVDYYAKPFDERLKLELTIDHDLIVKVRAVSEIRQGLVEAKIVDLEFGLKVPESIFTGQECEFDDKKDFQNSMYNYEIDSKKKNNNHELEVRSNISNEEDPKLIPGDGRTIGELSRDQKHEKSYYNLCIHCNRNSFQINDEGCDKCAAEGKAISCLEAQNIKEKRNSKNK